MRVPTAIKAPPSQWERQLKEQKDDRQRLVLLDRLVSHYQFTNANRAKALLNEMGQLTEQLDMPDFSIHYFLYQGFVENQLYNFSQAEEYFKKAKDIIEERGDITEQASVYIQLAGVYINQYEMDKASSLLDRATKQLKLFPEARLLARIVCREGYVHLHYSNYSKAIESLLEADKQFQAVPGPLDYMDYYFLTLVYSGLGKVFEHNNEWKKSVRAYRKAADMCENLGMRTRLSWHYLNVGSAYMALLDNENAEAYFKKALDERDDPSAQARASAYANLGYIAFQNRKLDEALKLFNRAERIYKKVKADDFYNFSNLERWRAQVFLEMGHNDKAMQHYVSAYDFAKKIQDYKQISGILKEIASYHADINDYKSAYEYQSLYDQYAEKYATDLNERRVTELEVKYDAEKKKKEAELLQLQATRLQLKALRAQMNPHFLYNALNGIQNYITSNEVKNASKYLAKFATLMRKSLEYSELEIISLEEEIEFLEDYLTINAKLRFEDKLFFEIEVDDEIEEDILGVPTMIIQPYVENAIEHGLRSRKKGNIKIIFSLLDDNNLLCVVEDNGIGREAASKLNQNKVEGVNFRSMGTSITEKRLEILHQIKGGEHYVHTIDLKNPRTGKPLGTRVEIKIPIVDIQLPANSMGYR
ncbi:MAG: histidine kinase [Lewinellaceae bacterium]|nr:histidine kinase [Lewinellaceae bacterium]